MRWLLFLVLSLPTMAGFGFCALVALRSLQSTLWGLHGYAGFGRSLLYPTLDWRFDVAVFVVSGALALFLLKVQKTWNEVFLGRPWIFWGAAREEYNA